MDLERTVLSDRSVCPAIPHDAVGSMTHSQKEKSWTESPGAVGGGEQAGGAVNERHQGFLEVLEPCTCDRVTEPRARCSSGRRLSGRVTRPSAAAGRGHAAPLCVTLAASCASVSSAQGEGRPAAFGLGARALCGREDGQGCGEGGVTRAGGGDTGQEPSGAVGAGHSSPSRGTRRPAGCSASSGRGAAGAGSCCAGSSRPARSRAGRGTSAARPHPGTAPSSRARAEETGAEETGASGLREAAAAPGPSAPRRHTPVGHEQPRAHLRRPDTPFRTLLGT